MTTEHPQYALYQNGVIIYTGNEWFIREQIESLLEEKINIFVSLQENTEEGYEFYLHSDNEDELSQEHLNLLNDHYGINTHDDESSQYAIENLLSIKVKPFQAAKGVTA